MKEKAQSYRTVKLSPARQVLVSVLDLTEWGHNMFALLEVDVTAARGLMDESEARTGEKPSFTGWLAFCLARAVDEDKSVQAYRKGRKQLVICDDVDVGMMVEHRWGESRAPIGHVLRQANRKSYAEIHRELRAIQVGPPPQQSEMPGWLKRLVRLPGPFVKVFVSFLRVAARRDPVGMFIATSGTVGITAVGMYGRGGGWGFAAPNGHSLSLVVGGISRKPAVVGDRIEPRDMLSLTLIFNHEVIDGAPAARFASRLVELIEGACGLTPEW